MKLVELAAATEALAAYGYDPATQAMFEARAREGAQRSNAVTGTLAPLTSAELLALPALGTPERARLRERGLAMVRAGQVGVVILAGGMATRFGGVVKAIVDVTPGASFLQIKQADVAALAEAAGAEIPMFVMSSFATHAAILAHVKDRGLATARTPIEVFPQLVALRLTPGGALFREPDGALSPYATGHGDLTFALRASGLLARFRAAGGTTLLMSNVDNLAATLDPAILGLHVEGGGAITAEVVRKAPGDKGGAPARLDGTPQIIEGFRFPPGFDQDAISVFNTNTFTLDAAAIDRDFALPYYRVEKQVDGRTAVQFERLVGELTAIVPSRFVEVPRTGADGRFLPAKDPEELARNLPAILEVQRSTRSLHDAP